MAVAKVDNIVYIETPEGVDIGLSPASLMQRAGAWAIDLLIKVGVFIILAIIFGIMSSILGSGEVAQGFSMLLFFVLCWIYGPWFEWRSGSTPGKKAMGLKVVSMQGTPIRLEQAIVRNFICFIELFPFPFIYSSAAVCMLFTRGNRRFGDLAAGTLVITYQKPTKKRRGWSRRRRQNKMIDVEPQRPPLALTAEEKSLLSSYYQRAANYVPEYRDELAEILYPLHRSHGEEADEKLLAYGAWLSGLQNGVEEEQSAPARPKKARLRRRNS